MATVSPRSARCLDPRRILLLTHLAVAAWIGMAIAAQADEAPFQATTPVTRDPDGPEYPVSQFVIQYAKEHAEHPPLDSWLPVDVQLGVRDARYTAPREGLLSETVSIGRSSDTLRVYRASALGSVSKQLVAALQELNLIGLYIGPHPSDIDPATEEDLRRPGDTVLRLVVSTGQLHRIRTIALAHTGRNKSRIDSRIHRNIRVQSPLQPPEDARDDTSDLLRKDVLEEYLHYLNRHPGRYVEASLAPAPDGEGVDLDFRINETRPYSAYFQSSNTGTTQTARWQNRIGFVHRQLTNRDDILTFEYMNAGGDKVHSVTASYEAPWFTSIRPSWWKKSGREPSWMSWFNRDRLPWWGVKGLRWRIDGNWTQFKASQLQGPNSTGPFQGFAFDGSDWSAGASTIYNFFQRGNLFIDLVTGLRVRGVSAVSLETQNLSSPILLLPVVELRLERQVEFAGLFANIGFEANVLPIDDPQNLGRPGAGRTWELLTWSAAGSRYLEPLLYPRAWRDTSTPATSTLGHEIYLSTRGQYSFGNRLISQATQVVGGLYSIRGYPQSTATGDDVYIGTFEYRLHLPRILPIHHGAIEVPWFGSFRWARQQPYGRADWDLIIRLFVDAGYTRQNAPSNPSLVTLREFNQFLAGAGLGAELTIKNNLRARIDYAWALKDSKDPLEPVTAGSNEIYFLFTLLY